MVFGGPPAPARNPKPRSLPVRRDPQLEPFLKLEPIAQEPAHAGASEPLAENPSPPLNQAPLVGPGPRPSMPSGQSDLERAIGGRFELPSLDLNEPLIGPAADSLQGAVPTLRPTPRGRDSSSSSDLNRDPETLSAVSSGLAAVVRQQVAARLELAAAYMDLGDEPRARQLLAQTLIDGDEAQRRIAQRLLNQLVRTG